MPPNMVLEVKDWQELLRKLHEAESALKQAPADSEKALGRVERALELVNKAKFVG